MSNAPSGITWVGPVFEPGGYGQVARNFVLEIIRQGIPLKIVPIAQRRATLDDLTQEEKNRLTAAVYTEVPENTVRILHMSPDGFPYHIDREAAANVGYTIFETDRIPAGWVEPCNLLDEVWVPTQFNMRTFAQSGVNANKLRLLPYGVEVSRLQRVGDSLGLHAPDEFVFLYVCAFDFRKGIDLLLEAYLQEFKRTDKVRLWLKTWTPPYAGVESAGDWIEAEYGERIFSSDAPQIDIIEGYGQADDLIRMYQDCSLYITTDRANGWGMPPMEAMALGKPAATIDWSGSTEFMKEGSALLIRPTGRMEPVHPMLAGARPEIYAGHQWAEVSVEEVRRVMRYAYDNPEPLAEIARKGQESILKDFSIERATQRMLQACAELERNARP